MAANLKDPRFNRTGLTRLDDIEAWVDSYQPAANPASQPPAMALPKPTAPTGLDAIEQWVDSYQPSTQPKPDPGLWQKTKNTGKAFSEGITDSAPQWKGQFGAVLEGGKPFEKEDYQDQWQREADAQTQGFLNAPGGQDPTLFGGVPVGQMKGEIAGNLPQIAGNVAAMGLGAIAGAPAGPWGVAGGALASGVASLYPMYRMSKTQAVRQFAEGQDAQNRAKGLPAMTLPERQTFQAQVEPDASKVAAYEVGTEVPGMALEIVPVVGQWVKAGTGPLLRSALSRAGVKQFAKGAGLGALTAAATEPVEEAVSNIGQRPIQNKYAAPGQAQPALDFTPEGMTTSLSEVTGPTLRGMLPMIGLSAIGGGVSSVGAARNRYNTAEAAVQAAKALSAETGELHTADVDPADPNGFVVEPAVTSTDAMQQNLGQEPGLANTATEEGLNVADYTTATTDTTGENPANDLTQKELSRARLQTQTSARNQPSTGQDSQDQNATEPDLSAALQGSTLPQGPLVNSQTDGLDLPATFTTAKGSTYTLHDDGTTTRTKSKHEGFDHAGDVGLKERSHKTVYVADTQPISPAGLSGKWRIVDHGGSLSILNKPENGKWGWLASSKNVPYSTTPEIGLHPIELWQGKPLQSGELAYSKIHPGNAITDVYPTNQTDAGLETESVLPTGEPNAQPRSPNLHQSNSGPGKPAELSNALRTDSGLEGTDAASDGTLDQTGNPTAAARGASDATGQGPSPVWTDPVPAVGQDRKAERAAVPPINPPIQPVKADATRPTQENVRPTTPVHQQEYSTEAASPIEVETDRGLPAARPGEDNQDGSQPASPAAKTASDSGTVASQTDAGLETEAVSATADNGSGLNQNALDLLASIDAGGIPMAWTNNLRKIAQQNGYTDIGGNPNNFIEWLKQKRKAYHEQIQRQTQESNEETQTDQAETPSVTAKAHTASETEASTNSESANPVAENPTIIKSKEDVAQTLANDLILGKEFASIVEARKRLTELTGEAIQPGTAEAKQADETIELAGVLAARRIVAQMQDPETTYDKLVKLTGQLPNLSQRTSTSVEQQAYSTPLPLAFVASELAGIENARKVLEPTAGNGALLIEASPKQAVVNELNSDRRKALQSQGFTVSQEDASKPGAFKGTVDAVIANPPFGVVRDENGVSKEFQITPQWRTTEIDHAIAMNALSHLDDNGKAVLIVGAPAKTLSEKGRSDAYNGKAKRAFYFTLYRDYNVTKHFTVSGALYAQQGAAWPVDVIVIEGRGKSARALPAAELPNLINSWEELKNELPTRQPKQENQATVPVDAGLVEEGTRPANSDAADQEPAGRGRTGAGVADDQPGELLPKSGTSPQTPRPDGDQLARAKPKELRERDGTGGESDTGGLGLKKKEIWQQSFEDVHKQGWIDYDGNQEKHVIRHWHFVPDQEIENQRADNSRKYAYVIKKALKEGKEVAPEALRDYKDIEANPISKPEAKPKISRQEAIQRLEELGGSHLFKNYDQIIEEIEKLENQQEQSIPTPERSNDQQKNGTPNTILANKTANTFQSTYTPSSKAKSVGTLVPRNLATATANALARVADKHGSVDGYVAKSLNYKQDDIPKYFSAEQVDALALILDNLEQGKGFIIGDQTGVGKGRVVAATIRWAILNHKAPIFVTEKPALYSDMLRDLGDIGMDNINPIVTNTDVDIPLDDEARRWYELAEKAKEKGERPPARFGEFLKNPSPGVHARALAEMTESGEMKGYDVVFTTYNQMQTVAGRTYPRHDFLSRMADGGVVIFDESHNAGGTVQRPSKASKKAGQDEHGGRAHMARQMAKLAHGVLYSSATYAKRPEVMDLYFRTDMGKVGSAENLRNALESGGVPLQQVVAAMLAESGQYIRREKSFDGIAYDTVPAPVNREFAENSATIMRDILEFDRLKASSIEAMDKALKAAGKKITGDKSTGGAGASSTNFTSVMHNLISQMLLMMKVEATAKEAVAALERGEKPVIAVANTMGAAIQEYADEAGIKPGDPIPLTFADLLKRYLQKSRRITEGEAYGEKVSRELTDQELGPFALAHYKATMQRIDTLGFKELPISPIDAIRQQIEAAGFKTGEITGRTAQVDYSKPTPIFRRRGQDEVSTAGKRKTINNFNAGKLDAVIINQSGATGISLHASERNPKAGQAKRVMIIAQPELNIDTHMQILGRVNRTGQVVLPSYIQLVADIPAEKRPAAVLAKKMAMLNANTSANKRSAVTAKDVPDFMNQYGDQVAAQVMWDNEEWHKALGKPLDPASSGEGYEPEGAIRKVTGRIPLLPLKVQEELYAEIEQSYNDLIDQLDRMGENALEAKTLDLDAKTVNTVELKPKVDNSGSPFSEALNAEELNIKHQGKPMTLEEIDKATLAPFAKEEDPQAALKQHYEDLKQQIRTDYKAYGEALIEKHSQDEDGKGLQADQARLQLHGQKVVELLRDHPVGTKVFLKTLSGSKLAGVIGKIERKGRTVSPVAPSAWKVTFYLADPMRQITLPLSKLGFGEQDKSFLGVPVLDAVGATAQDQHTQQFEDGQSVSREKRVMLTGNLLAGYSSFGNGRIVHYTTRNGEIRQGVMMGNADKLDKLQASQPVSFATPELAAGYVRYRRKDGGAAWMDANDKQMRLTVDDRPNAILTVPASKADGGKYFLDAGLRSAIGDDFYKRGDTMQASFPQRQLDAVLNRLYALGVRFEVDTYKQEAREYLQQRSSDAAERNPGDNPSDYRRSVSGWHGSPAEFERFSWDMIGTGEAGQAGKSGAYGFGHYIAGLDDVAEYYRKALSYTQDHPFDVAAFHGAEPAYPSYYRTDNPINAEGLIAGAIGNFIPSKPTERLSKWDIQDAKNWLVRELQSKGYPSDAVKAIAARMDAAKPEDFKITRQGKLYQVELTPDHADFLDLDKPLSEQTPQVKAGIAKVWATLNKRGNPPATSTGEEFYHYLSNNLQGDESASLALFNAGIPGNTYKDASARGTDKASYNYVVFDDGLINIQARFAKRQALPFKGMTKDAAQDVVDSYLRGFKGLGRLKVKVYGTQNEAGKGSSKHIIEAEFHIPTDTLIIIAENFRNAPHLLKKMSHEVIGHYAPRKLLQKEDHDQLMREVERAAKANPDFRQEWIRISGRDPRTGRVVNANAAYFKPQAKYDRAEIADEVLAFMAEKGIENGWMRRIIDLITRLLRKIGVIRGPMSQREMLALLARAERNLVGAARGRDHSEDKRGMVGRRRLSQAQAQGYQGTDTGEAEEWLRAKAKGLDMSHAARMERAREMGFDTDKVWYHGSTERVKEVTYGNVFDGLFLSSSDDTALSHGDVLNEFFSTDKILDGTPEDYERTIEIISKRFPDASESQIEDILYPAIAEDANVFNMDEDEVLELTGDDSLGEASWRMQNERGYLAKALGYDVVSMDDEHGTSYFSPKGAKLRSVDAAFDPDYAESGNLRASFGGERANLTAEQREGLAQAKAMEAEGVKPKQIWQETGWFKAPWDGRWRFEINDKTAQVYGGGPVSTAAILKGMEVGKALHHPSLYYAYGDIQDIPLEFDGKNPTGGAYAHAVKAQDQGIRLGGYADKSTLLHETQHAIQHRDGMARGGSPQDFVNETEYAKRRMTELEQWFEKEEDKASAEAETWIAYQDNHEQEIKNALDYLNKEELNDTSLPLKDRLSYAIVNQDRLYNKRYDEWRELNKILNRSHRTNYLSLAGEAEARLVQARMDLTAKQRREQFPLDSLREMLKQEGIDPGANFETLIVRYGDGTAASVPPPDQTDSVLKTESVLLAPNGKPSNLNAIQYAQVRTPQFKAWFGDWENDPANASKVVDENGEPLVVYHGTSSYEDDSFNTFKENYGGIYLSDNPDISELYQNNYGHTKELYANINNIFDAINMSKENINDIAEIENDLFGASDEDVVKSILKSVEEIDDDDGITVAWKLNYKNKSKTIKENPDYLNENEIMDLFGIESRNDKMRGPDGVESLEELIKWGNLIFLGRDVQNDVLENIKNKGYDGVRMFDFHGGAENERAIIVFDSSNIKSATGNTGAFSPTNSDIRYSKATADTLDALNSIGRSQAELGNEQKKQPGPIRKAFIQAWRKLKVNAKRESLGVLTPLQLVEVSEHLLPGMKDYAQEMSKLAMHQNRIIQGYRQADVKNWQNVKGVTPEQARQYAEVEKLGADRIAELHQNLGEAQMNQLADVQHEATLYGLTPAEGFKPLIDKKETIKQIALLTNFIKQRSGQEQFPNMRGMEGAEGTGKAIPGVRTVANLMDERAQLRMKLAFEKKREANNLRVQAMYDALSPEAKRVYRLERDSHLVMSHKIEQGLTQMIEDSEIDRKRKDSSISELRHDFESQRASGDYFPLYRQGDFWAYLQGKPGDERGALMTIIQWDANTIRVDAKDKFSRNAYKRLKNYPGSEQRTVNGKTYFLIPEQYHGNVESAFADELEDQGPQPGEKSFHLFQTPEDRDEYVKQMQAEGMELLSQGTKTEKLRELDGVSAEFVGKVEDLLSQLGTDPMVQAVQDQIWQLYLKSLPDLSARKHMIHRNKTPGYGNDSLLAFSNKLAHDAYGYARLMVGKPMRDTLSNIKQDIEAAETPSKLKQVQGRLEQLRLFTEMVINTGLPNKEVKAIARNTASVAQGDGANRDERLEQAKLWDGFAKIVDQWGSSRLLEPAAARARMERRVREEMARLQQRIGSARKILAEDDGLEFAANVYSELQQAHQHIMNPKTSSATVIMNQIGYLYAMAFSPAAWLTNLMQTPTKSMPYVAAKMGVGSTYRAFEAASKLIFGKLEEKKATAAAEDEPLAWASIRQALTGEERKAYEIAEDTGRIDNTRAHDLWGFAEEGQGRGTFARKWAWATGFGFHETERANREITFLASFRLARDTGMEFDKAVDYALHVVDKTHLAYSAQNRARMMRSGLSRVAFQFKTYSQGMLYLWARSGYQWLLSKSATAEEKAEARRYVLMQGAVQIAAAGAMGLPIGGLWLVLKAALDGDDDDPEVFEGEFRQALADFLGVTGGRGLSKGIFNMWSPIDMHSRLSERDLFWRDMDREYEGKDLVSNALMNVAGPSIGVVGNIADGIRLWGEGHWERAIEKWLPKGAASLLKAGRYATEGARTMKGDALIPEFTAGELAGQALGFTPSRLADRYDENDATKTVEKRTLERRQDLIDKARIAMENGDKDGLNKAHASIAAYNKAQPERKIKRQDIGKSLQMNRRNRARSVDGMLLDRKLKRGLDERYEFAG